MSAPLQQLRTSLGAALIERADVDSVKHGTDAGDMIEDVIATRSWCVTDLSLSQSAVEAALSISPE